MVVGTQQNGVEPGFRAELHIRPKGGRIPVPFSDVGNPGRPFYQGIGMKLDFRREGIETEVPGVGCIVIEEVGQKGCSLTVIIEYLKRKKEIKS